MEGHMYAMPEERNMFHDPHQSYSRNAPSNGRFSSYYNDSRPPYHQGYAGSFMGEKQWYGYEASGSRPSRKRFTCSPCNRTFYNQEGLDEHLKDHVECPFPECKLSAHVKIIDQHINNQHMLVNFAALQIDDETWISERKKRFPTAQRAELRRAQQMEKLKRGEKLGMSSKPFAKTNNGRGFKGGKRETNGPSDKNMKAKTPYDKNLTRVAPDKNITEKKENTLSNKVKENQNSEGDPHDSFKHRKRARFERPPRPVVEVDLYASDEEPLGVPPFKGTKHFYESIGEMNYFSSNHVTKDFSPEKDFIISDDEEWEHKQEDENKGKLVLGGALGSLMGTYSDSEEDCEEASTITEDDKKSEVKMTAAMNKKPEVKLSLDKENNNSDTSKKRLRAETQSKDNDSSRKRRRFHKNQKDKRPNGKLHVPKRPRRRKYLLERLLQADIIHERNIILQCVRFIVENNFFENPTSEKGTGLNNADVQVKESNSEHELQKKSEVNLNTPSEVSTNSGHYIVKELDMDHTKVQGKESNSEHDLQKMSEVNNTPGEASANSGHCTEKETHKDDKDSQVKEGNLEHNLQKMSEVNISAPSELNGNSGHSTEKETSLDPREVQVKETSSVHEVQKQLEVNMNGPNEPSSNSGHFSEKETDMEQTDVQMKEDN